MIRHSIENPVGRIPLKEELKKIKEKNPNPSVSELKVSKFFSILYAIFLKSLFFTDNTYIM